MSKKNFIEAYKNSDTKTLRKYIKSDVVLSTHNFMTRVEESFISNRDVYDVLVLILCNKYDLDKVVIDIIQRDNIDLLESVLSYAKDEIEENLIEYTLPKGRISMAKLIYEYIHKEYDLEDSISESDSDSEIDMSNCLFAINLLIDYEFVYNKKEKSIDSFVIALSNMLYEDAVKIIPYIDPSFWNNFGLKYAVAAGNLLVVKKLLQHPSVDPGIEDSAPLKIALCEDYYDVANELLKHHLVKIDELDIAFIAYLIKNNCVCSMEKILNSKIMGLEFCFKIPELAHLAFSCQNDVTYLLINMKKITTTDRKIKRNLKYYKITKPYIEKPYDQKIDPRDIIKQAIKHNDMALAKSIINYSVSINSFDLMCYLITYKNSNKDDEEQESVYDYIWENVLPQYDPNCLLVTAFVIDRNIVIHNAVENLHLPEFYDINKIILKMIPKYDTTLYDQIIEIVKDNPKLNLKTVYEENDAHREGNWQQIKDICDIDELKIFIENLIADNMISIPLCEDFDELEYDDQMEQLDIAFDNFVF